VGTCQAELGMDNNQYFFVLSAEVCFVNFQFLLFIEAESNELTLCEVK
jgi:hypothetical protein